MFDVFFFFQGERTLAGTFTQEVAQAEAQSFAANPNFTDVFVAPAGTFCTWDDD